MAQFDVHSNRSPETRDRIPYLLDVQSDLLDPLATRVVVPLASRDSVRVPPAERLMPGFDVEGHSVVMLTPQIVGVPRASLGPRVGSLAHQRHEIIAALDVLVSGV